MGQAGCRIGVGIGVGDRVGKGMGPPLLVGKEGRLGRKEGISVLDGWNTH